MTSACAWTTPGVPRHGRRDYGGTPGARLEHIVDGATFGTTVELVAMALWAFGYACFAQGVRLWLTGPD